MKSLKVIVTVYLLFIPLFVMAQAGDIPADPIEGAIDYPSDIYYKAQIMEITDQQTLGAGEGDQIIQTLKVKIISGDEKDKEVVINGVGGLTINGGRGFQSGDKVVINKTVLGEEVNYYVVDVYRIPGLIGIVLVFLLVVIVFSKWRGLSSLLGLAVTIGVIVKYVAPQIYAGKDPLSITLIASTAIVLTSLYLAHGFNKRTSVAAVSTFITLGIAVVIAYAFVHFTKLFGNGSEESIYLQFGPTAHINLQGLLLSGIILGALGVLDDITTAQSATVDELKKANPRLNFKQLYSGAASVGKEHISSLINTLFLAYAGVSLPLFLLFTSTGGGPLWVTLNAEFIAEEIVRTLVGSVTLIVAVPITTLLAAYYFSKKGPSSVEGNAHTH